MRLYKIPFDIKHEEKVFGGYLSIRQAIYLMFGVLSLAILFIPMINMIIKATFFIIFATMFVLFAFLKIDETYSDKYFIYILKFFFRRKKYILER